MSAMRILAMALPAAVCCQCARPSANAEFDFAREIGTILTRKGCNGASCHGGVKGRGGFKLSSGAFHPKEDYEWIVKGGTYQVLTTEVKGERIPRVKVAEPEKSLLLLKATGAVSPRRRQALRSGLAGVPEACCVDPERRAVWPRTTAGESRGATRGLLHARSLSRKAAPASLPSRRISRTDEPRS